MKPKNKIIITSIIISLIIIAGIATIILWGFNKELKYQEGQKIDIYIEKQVDAKKIKEIADEVLGMHNIVKIVEVYQDMVTIKATNISEDDKNDIVNKVKEIYEFNQTAEATTIDTVPATKIIDMYKQYILPFVISIILVSIYMGIRYYKNGILKVLSKSIFIPLIAELILLSWIAIARIPVGRFTPMLVILIYVISVIYVTRKNEK